MSWGGTQRVVGGGSSRNSEWILLMRLRGMRRCGHMRMTSARIPPVVQIGEDAIENGHKSKACSRACTLPSTIGAD